MDRRRAQDFGDERDAKVAEPWPSLKGGAFDKLPDEIIQQILRLTSPDVFASLVLLNRKWRLVSQQAPLYAYHLKRCPSYSAANHAVILLEDEQSLPKLRRLFAREAKRNLFEAYLRPTETIISLVSTSISSSSAPAGEAFHFSISPLGHFILAYSSSRLYVIDTTGHDMTVRRELKILRKPAATTITDDGALLAVLSTDLQIDLYDLSGDIPKHTRAIALDHTPRTIALSPTGSVLAAAYDSGVEVSSLDISHQNTDRRSVKCYAVDALSFSRDGTQLLGSTLQSQSPSTVILTAPYYDPGASSPEESVSALWTTSILFPNGSRDCSHAVLLPSPVDEESSWTFTYDRVFETFRAVRIDDLRNGTTYFTGPVSDSATKLIPSTLPSASGSGDLVAAGFQDSVWLYGVPEDLEAVPLQAGVSSNAESEVSTPGSQLGRRNSAPSLRSSPRPMDSTVRTPQWQLLCDRFRNTFIEGRQVTNLERVSAMSWVVGSTESCQSERLVAVAPGILSQSLDCEVDGMTPVDGGRICILDFAYSLNNGGHRTVTIEVGLSEPQTLEEEHRDLDAEVAIVRRRTVAQRRGNRSHVTRSATTVPRHSRQDPPAMPVIQDVADPYALSTRFVRRASQQTTSTEISESSVDDLDAFDAPYSHNSPRSGTTLRRAATAAAVNRRFHPRGVAQGHVEYRRADGREEHPHESDADNWVPPPPPYTRDPIPPLPDHIQRSILAETAANLHRANTHRAPSLDFSGPDAGALTRSRTVASTSTSSSRRERSSFQRTFSDTTATTDRLSFEEHHPRPSTSPGVPDDDIYDVSPPGTPQPAERQLALEQRQNTVEEVAVTEHPLVTQRENLSNQIPRRPVGAPTNDTRVSPARPVMSASLQQPVSPIPIPLRPRTEDFAKSVERASQQSSLPILNSDQLHSNPPTDLRMSSTIPLPVHTDKEMPPRPDDQHHLTELPPTTPIFLDQRTIIESQASYLPRRSETVPVISTPQQSEDDPVPIWRRTGTAPAAITTSDIDTSGFVMPSSDQLARLNSRTGRPPGASDPRRRSGSSGRNSCVSSSDLANRGSNTLSHVQMRNEISFASAPSHGAMLSHSGYQQRSNTGSPSPSRSPNPIMQARRVSSSPVLNNRQTSQPPPNSNAYRPQSNSPQPRPGIQRLDTIHSVTHSIRSQGEPSTYFTQRQINLGRRPSRAERGAAKNIKDAKKKGWGSSMRKSEKLKDKYEDSGDPSPTGWTDVAGNGKHEKKNGKEKGSKCVIM